MASTELFLSPLFKDANLVGYYRLESNYTDSSPNGYTLTATGTPSDVTGEFGNGKLFAAASSQYASIANASCPNLEISGSQSWVCWVKTTTNVSYQVPIGKSSTDGTVKHYILCSNDSGGVVYFALDGLTTNTQVSSTGLTPVGVWTFIVGVYNSAKGTLSIYINGKLDGQVAASGSASSTGGDFAIGRKGGSNAFYFDGTVDDVAIFNRALTAQEIKNLYDDSFSPIGLRLRPAIFKPG